MLLWITNQPQHVVLKSNINMEYEFFHAEGPIGKFSSNNTAIRSHTMKNALRAPPNTTRKLQAASEEALRREAIGLSGRFPVRVQTQKQRADSPRDQLKASSRGSRKSIRLQQVSNFWVLVRRQKSERSLEDRQISQRSQLPNGGIWDYIIRSLSKLLYSKHQHCRLLAKIL